MHQLPVADVHAAGEHQAAVGDQVLIEGKVTLDVDLGAGYSYPVLLEEATVSVESET